MVWVLPIDAYAKAARRRELQDMRNVIGGGRRIADIYNSGRDDADIFIPASFTASMISAILKREFPGVSDRRVDVGDVVRTEDGFAGTVVTMDDACREGYVRIHDDTRGIGMQLLTIASLRKIKGPQP